MTRHTPLILIAACCVIASAQTQRHVDVTAPYAWGENVGYLNAGTNLGASSAIAFLPSGSNPGFLRGFIWGENIGWINLGSGAGPYANSMANGLTHGVNMLPDMDPMDGVDIFELEGRAWGENVGWINFGTTSLKPFNQHARYDATNRRFRGYAWGENIGWINLDSANLPLRLVCPADFNSASAFSPAAMGWLVPDGLVTPADFVAFNSLWLAGDLRADINTATANNPLQLGFGIPDGILTPTDFVAFTFFFSACQTGP